MAKKATSKQKQSDKRARRVRPFAVIKWPLKLLRWVRFPRYFRDSAAEIRRVVWPKRREALKLMMAVIIFTVVLTLFTAVLDYGLGEAAERIFL